MDHDPAQSSTRLWSGVALVTAQQAVTGVWGLPWPESLFTRVPTVEVQLPGPAVLMALAARASLTPAGTTPGRADRS